LKISLIKKKCFIYIKKCFFFR